MRANALVRQRWRGPARLLRETLDYRVDPGARKWLEQSVQEDPFRAITSGGQRPQGLQGHRPERAGAQLLAFAQYLHTSGIPVDVSNRKRRGFAGSGSGVVEEEQQRMFSATLNGGTIRGLKQRIHFGAVQARDCGRRKLLERYLANLACP